MHTLLYVCACSDSSYQLYNSQRHHRDALVVLVNQVMVKHPTPWEFVCGLSFPWLYPLSKSDEAGHWLCIVLTVQKKFHVGQRCFSLQDIAASHSKALPAKKSLPDEPHFSLSEWISENRYWSKTLMGKRIEMISPPSSIQLDYMKK